MRGSYILNLIGIQPSNTEIKLHNTFIPEYDIKRG